MAPIGAICWCYDSGNGDEDGPEFIRCVDGQEPQIHKVWNFGEDGIKHKVHLTARVDFGVGFVGEFSTNSLTPSWRRIPIFGVNSINGSVQWLDVPDPLRTDGPPGLIISCLPVLIWELVVLPPIQTGESNLVGPM